MGTGRKLKEKAASKADEVVKLSKELKASRRLSLGTSSGSTPLSNSHSYSSPTLPTFDSIKLPVSPTTSPPPSPTGSPLPVSPSTPLLPAYSPSSLSSSTSFSFAELSSSDERRTREEARQHD